MTSQGSYIHPLRGRAGGRRSLAATCCSLLALAFLAPSAEAAGAAQVRAQGCPNANARAGQVSPGELAAAIGCVLNSVRAELGLGALRPDQRLAATAGSHATDMVDRGYFGHASPDGGAPEDRVAQGFGRRPVHVGEVIAWGSIDRSIPREVVAAWMTSAGHRRVISQPGFTLFGIGVAPGAPGSVQGDAATYVVSFAGPVAGRRGISGSAPRVPRRRRR